MQARPLTPSAMLLPAVLIATLLAPTARPAPQGGGSDAMGPPYRSVTFEEESVEIPIELAGSLVLVDGVYVNGEGPFRFMLDTGAQGAGRVDTSLAERLGLLPEGQVQGGDGTGRRGPDMDMYVLETLEIGGLRAEGARVISRDYNERGAGARGHIDGILGIDLFDDVLLTIDYPREVLRFERGSLPEPDGREVLPLVPDRAIPTITLELAGRSHDAYLDSGAMGPLVLPASLQESLPLTGEPRVVGQARTVSGAFDIAMATVDGELTIGRHVTRRPQVMFGGPFRDVIVSSEVLAEHAVTLDQASGRARFLRGGLPAHESAPGRTSLDQDELRVPMESVLGRPVIEAKIAGKGPFRFILDTGASTTVLNADLARELALAATGETRLGVPGGEQRVPATTHVIPVVTVGAATFRDVPAMSWDHPAITGALGDVRGIIGLPLFHDLLTTLDAPGGELVLAHGSLPADAIAYTIDAGGLPEIEIDVAGRAIPAHIDTGNPSGQLAVPMSAAAELPLAHEPRVIGRGRTASGEFEIRGAPLKGNADVAGVVLENPVLHFQEWNEHANVGGAVLAGAALTFDQRARRLRVGAPGTGPEGGAAVQRSIRKASGKRASYGIMFAGIAGSPIQVSGVVPGGVAERAGLEAGDAIVALNGVEVSELDQAARGEALRAPELKLTVERDGERLEFALAHDSDE